MSLASGNGLSAATAATWPKVLRALPTMRSGRLRSRRTGSSPSLLLPLKSLDPPSPPRPVRGALSHFVGHGLIDRPGSSFTSVRPFLARLVVSWGGAIGLIGLGRSGVGRSGGADQGGEPPLLECAHRLIGCYHSNFCAPSDSVKRGLDVAAGGSSPVVVLVPYAHAVAPRTGSPYCSEVFITPSSA